MDVTLVLLTSPLVGPSTWRPTHDELTRRGHPSTVIDLRDVVTGDGPDLGSAIDSVTDATAAEPLLLVPHSGAGPLTPWLLAGIPAARGTIFVDAGLPPPDVARIPLAPPAFLDHLEGLADPRGMLPPWASWWDAHVMAEVVPDAALRARLSAEMRPLPLGYFRSTVPVPGEWSSVRGAYLAFGDGSYADDIARARSFGWPVEVLPGAGHLHPAVAPEEVAGALVRLIAALTA